MFHFANPLFLLLLFLIPLLYYLDKKLKKGTVRFSNLNLIKESRGEEKKFPLLILLKLLIIFLLIICLARPQGGEKSREITKDSVDIILCLDISGSMKAEDFQPKNRLYVAKEVSKEFIQKRKNDRIGLVVFSKQSFTQCPLTLDHQLLLQFLKQVKIGMVEDGTAIGLGVANSINRLKNSEAKSKIIILLTDGVNNSGKIDPLTAANLAKIAKIKIYTIGVGKEGFAPYPVNDAMFGRRYVQIKTEIDEETLIKIAETTNGLYFRAADASGLRRIYTQIDKMQKTEIKSKEYVSYYELFRVFLFPAFILFLGRIILERTYFRKIP